MHAVHALHHMLSLPKDTAVQSTVPSLPAHAALERDRIDGMKDSWTDPTLPGAVALLLQAGKSTAEPSTEETVT